MVEFCKDSNEISGSRRDENLSCSPETKLFSRRNLLRTVFKLRILIFRHMKYDKIREL